MVERIIKKAIKKSNAREVLPVFASAEKVINEVSEHFGLVRWSFSRIILPISIFYIIMGLVFQEHILGALFTAFIVFLYANFLPDLDAFFPHGGAKCKKAGKYEKRIALFFTPVIIYYVLSRKLAPIDLGSQKAFHTKRALLEFSLFLFVFGLLLYFSVLKAFFFAFYGFLGYFTHLIVDRQIKII